MIKSITFLVLLMLLPAVQGLSIDSNIITYDIAENTVRVKQNLQITLEKPETVNLQIPYKYNRLNILVDNEEINYSIEKNILILNLNPENKNILLEFETKEYLEFSNKNLFIVEFTTPVISKFVNIEVLLPPGYVLDKPIEDGKSVYPDPTSIVSDGQRIILKFERNNLEENIPILIAFKSNTNLTYFIAPFVAIIAFLAYFIMKKPKLITKTIFTNPNIHLREDEKQIVKIIENKGGSIEQGTLVTISDFSKAKISQLLKELEERKIIKKIQKGKKNIILLKSKIPENEQN